MTEIHEYNLALEATGRSSEVCPLTVVVSVGTGLIPVTEVGIIFCSLYYHWSHSKEIKWNEDVEF
jgi:hypothetical protein